MTCPTVNPRRSNVAASARVVHVEARRVRRVTVDLVAGPLDDAVDVDPRPFGPRASRTMSGNSVPHPRTVDALVATCTGSTRNVSPSVTSATVAAIAATDLSRRTPHGTPHNGPVRRNYGRHIATPTSWRTLHVLTCLSSTDVRTVLATRPTSRGECRRPNALERYDTFVWLPRSASPYFGFTERKKMSSSFAATGRS